MDQAEGLRHLARKPRVGASGRTPLQRRGARVIAVTSGKGGVGKSNVAVNLGILLAQSGYRVGILDADMGLANVDLLLGLTAQYHLSHVLAGEKELFEIGLSGPEGLVIYPGGPGLTELANLSRWRLEHLVKRLTELDQRLDLLLIDTGAGIGHSVTAFVRAAEEILLVTTPEPTAIRDAYAVAKAVTLDGTPARIHLIVNKASPREADSVSRNLNMMAGRFLEMPQRFEFLGHVPLDERVVRSVIEQTPFILQYPNTPASRALRAIIQRIDATPPASPGGIVALFRRLIGRSHSINPLRNA